MKAIALLLFSLLLTGCASHYQKYFYAEFPANDLKKHGYTIVPDVDNKIILMNVTKALDNKSELWKDMSSGGFVLLGYSSFTDNSKGPDFDKLVTHADEIESNIVLFSSLIYTDVADGNKQVNIHEAAYFARTDWCQKNMLGIVYDNIKKTADHEYGIGEGVVVKGLCSGHTVNQIDLRPWDVIISINGVNVRSVDDMENFLNQTKEKNFIIHYMRMKRIKTTYLNLEGDRLPATK